jgi:cyclopropane fatty-acyl-phospholipid synthase-like methyltransferase
MHVNQTSFQDKELARLYQLLHTGNEGDLEFYCGFVQPNQHVLELGCGSGRLAIALAKKQVYVVGVDSNPAHLHLANQKCKQEHLMEWATFIQDDMRSFQSDARFDAVFIAYNSLYCLSSELEQINVLKKALSHLKPDGVLIFDGYILPDPAEYLYESDADFEPLTLLEVKPDLYVGVEEKDVHQ